MRLILFDVDSSAGEHACETARSAMARRGMEFTSAQRAMWEAIYADTAAARSAVIDR
ncbi:MAG: hypothetical protein ACYTFO_11020 [Planctomycetota bacterium]|jgi:hypothetical protein